MEIIHKIGLQIIGNDPITGAQLENKYGGTDWMPGSSFGLNLPLSSYNPYYNSTIPDTGIYYIYCRIKISGGGFSFSGVSAQVSL